MITECAICYNVSHCFDDGEAYICVDRQACANRAMTNNSKVVKAPFAKCDQCPLRDRPCVPTFTGSDDLQLVIVGEAPGSTEVSTGVPFTGPSGQMLDYLLDQIGLVREECLITNAVLCRPLPGEAVPNEAIMACRERLGADLRAAPSAQVVSLGAIPFEALRASHEVTVGIMKARGQWFETDEGREFLATLHPAFVLRQPNYFNALQTDFRALTLDRSKDWLQTKYYELDVTNSFWFLNVPDNTPVAFDVETTGLDAHKADLLCLAISWSTEFAIIIPHDQIIPNRLFLQRFFDRVRPIAHNGKFDCHVLARYGLTINLADDTMLQHYALDETKGTHGLKQLGASYLGVQDYETQLVDKHFKVGDREKRNYGTIPQGDLYHYVAIDVCVTLALNEVFQPLIDKDNVRQAYNILIDASNALQLSERKGIKIDRPYLQKVLGELLKAIKIAKTKVQLEARQPVEDYIERVLIDPKWKNPDPTWIKGNNVKTAKQQYLEVLERCVDVNLSSWQQMQVLLYDVLGLTHQKKVGFKTKPRSTNAEALDALSPLNHPFVKVLQEYRRLDKIRSTYVEPLLRLADENDRVHVNFLLHGTETGRLSASDSLHGIPRPSDIWGQAIRGSFIADVGKKLTIADYSQAELRIFAALSGEPFLLDAFNRGEDVHDNTTVLLFANDLVVQHAFKTRQWIDNDWIYQSYGVLSAKDVKNYWKEYRTIAKKELSND